VNDLILGLRQAQNDMISSMEEDGEDTLYSLYDLIEENMQKYSSRSAAGARISFLVQWRGVSWEVNYEGGPSAHAATGDLVGSNYWNIAGHGAIIVGEITDRKYTRKRTQYGIVIGGENVSTLFRMSTSNAKAGQFLKRLWDSLPQPPR